MLAVFAALLAFAAGVGEIAGIEAQLTAGNYQLALTKLDSIPFEARNPAWHLLASRAYDGLNDPAKAVEEAQAALSLAPGSEAAHLQLAQIFLFRNTPLPAYEILSRASTLFPDSAPVRLGVGLALKELQRYDEAIQVLTECLRLKPDLGPAFDALGAAYLDANRYDDLLSAATGYRRRNPKDFRGYYYLAAAREKLQLDPAGTEILIRRSIDYNSRFAASYALLGKVLMGSGRLEPAAGALEEAVRLRPDYTPAHYYLANVYRKLGRDDDARREFAAVSRLKEEETKPVPKLSYHRGDRPVPADQK
jgi:tetratricopeptide (TPR) repeat protein